MPELTGTVRCIQVGDDFAFTTVNEQGTTTRETFILWWSGVSTPQDPPVYIRIIQSDWIALLREALAGNVPVTVFHGTNSAVVLNVQFGQF
jgi:hypothetical protein